MFECRADRRLLHRGEERCLFGLAPFGGVAEHG